jgi:hypothetical protein
MRIVCEGAGYESNKRERSGLDRGRCSIGFADIGFAGHGFHPENLCLTSFRTLFVPLNLVNKFACFPLPQCETIHSGKKFLESGRGAGFLRVGRRSPNMLDLSIQFIERRGYRFSQRSMMVWF